MAKKSYYHSMVLKDPCVWCGKFSDRPTLEHIHPLVFGGPKRAWFNLARACARCNNQRGQWSLLEYLMRKQAVNEKKWKKWPYLIKTRRPSLSMKRLSKRDEDWYYPLHALLKSGHPDEFVL